MVFITGVYHCQVFCFDVVLCTLRWLFSYCAIGFSFFTSLGRQPPFKKKGFSSFFSWFPFTLLFGMSIFFSSLVIVFILLLWTENHKQIVYRPIFEFPSTLTFGMVREGLGDSVKQSAHAYITSCSPLLWCCDYLHLRYELNVAHAHSRDSTSILPRHGQL